MITANQVLEQLKASASTNQRNIRLKNGAREPVLGIKVADLKKLQKQIKTNHQLALELYNTGVFDAMYLAALIADDSKMTKDALRSWIARANSTTLSEYTVPWVAAGSDYGYELALEWITAEEEQIAAGGWATLSNWISMKDDSEIDLSTIGRLLRQIEQTIHNSPDRVRYTMNGFVIAVGSYMSSLTDRAIKTAEEIGAISIDMGETACRVPNAKDYIRSVQKRGIIGRKRKTVKC